MNKRYRDLNGRKQHTAKDSFPCSSMVYFGFGLFVFVWLVFVRFGLFCLGSVCFALVSFDLIGLHCFGFVCLFLFALLCFGFVWTASFWFGFG